MSDGALVDRICSRLRAATGVDFPAYKRPMIARRLQLRMVAGRFTSLAEYARKLDEDPAEVQALFQSVLILVTGFFRDPESFEALRTRVLPRVIAGGRPADPIRVWSAGCSTGEEPYSVIMLLLESLTEHGSDRPVVVFATDVSQPALVRARAGVYPSRIARDVTPARLARFFKKTVGGYRIDDIVRRRCFFARHDLTSDVPYSNLDLILCRNVLMFMGAPLQRKILAGFHYALKPNCFLMLGQAETITGSAHLFVAEDSEHHLYARQPGATAVLA